ncbi:peptidoglycan-binding protein [Pseudomonas endophytica]|uniref:Peptidoglycan-binding protein n=1 Tax=Pseudomonas endophytica TaxID=1563157 RepID=A0A0Q0SR68_9PSED|nr:FimV/HubP family polar landmark protein [Pseudomonas endophytica]KQB54601.1 peptidoglycan-binding protein [Pseudomonas endophytica]
MVQVRKLVLAIAAASALSSGMAQALGLGELTLKSTQNQPLLAEIELLDVKDLSAAELVPSLAPADEFSKAGVPRPSYLDDLRFTPVINANGKSVLRVTSSQPLSEPFVKFLVQVMWPSGRLMRDYSVLLDPAKYSPQTAAAAAAGSATGAEPAQYTTSARDTLWEIAAKSRNGGSVQQTMLAIQALNPDAFIDGNINRLKTGQVLRLPNAEQSAELPQAKAVSEVALQNADWRSGRRTAPRAQQLDATARKPAATVQPTAEVKDSLSLVAGQAGNKGAGADAKNISDKLAITQESLDTSRRESAELQSRLQDLQSQLDKLQRIIELKNNQLAALQGDASTPVDPQAVLPAQLSAQAADTPEADIAPATEGTPATAIAPTPQTDATSSDERSIQNLLASPLLMQVAGAAAVLLLLLLLLLLIRRRKAQQASERHARMARALEEDEPEFAADFDLPESSFEGIESPAASVKLDAAPASASASAPTPAVAPVVPVAASNKSGAEVLVEAEQLIQQQQFHEAAGLLEGAVRQAPQRSDLRLKLMQVYGELDERDAFVAQERQLVANGKNYAEVSQLKLRYPAMAAVAGGIVAAAVASQFQADFVKEMMRDDRVVEAEPDLKPSPAVTPPEEQDHDVDLSLDDTHVTPEQSFDEVLKQQAEAQAALDIAADYDLDLPEDFDLSLAEEVSTPEVPDSFSLELDKVNAELQRLSQSFEEPEMAEPFAGTEVGAEDEPEFDFLSGSDEAATKLDLAQAYIDMGDDEGARDILAEVMGEGSPEQQAEAIELLSRLA